MIDAHGNSIIAQYGYNACQTPGSGSPTYQQWTPSAVSGQTCDSSTGAPPGTRLGADCCASGPLCANGDTTCSNLINTPNPGTSYLPQSSPRGVLWGNTHTCNWGSIQGNTSQATGNCGWAGQWVRTEVCANNAGGGSGYTVEWYFKTLTHNDGTQGSGQEYKIIDTSIAGNNFAENWTTALATTLTPPHRIDAFAANMYRQSNDGTCYGTSGIMYLMHAAWTTSAGQRIGAATEVESGAGGTNTLSVAKTGTGTGTVTSAPGAINCGSACAYTYTTGTSVTLTATPSAGSTFSGWSGGGCSGTGSTCAVTVSSDFTVTASFAATGSAGPCGTGTTLAIFSGGGNHLQNQGTGALACQ